MSWFEEWFNQDYLALYPHRDEEEARRQILAIVQRWTPGPDVLDLACGTGRHTKVLQELGYKVIGIDLSDQLRPLGPNYLKRDMRDLEGLGPFDLVISLFTSFGYFDDTDNQKVLDEVLRVLKPGGLFILDYLHPAAIKEGSDQYATRTIKGNRIEKEINYKGRRYKESVRIYSLAELEEIFSQFIIEGVFNDFDWNPYRPDGDRQIVVARHP